MFSASERVLYGKRQLIEVICHAGENPEELKVIYVNKDVSTHFIAMEDIKYVLRTRHRYSPSCARRR